MATRRELCLWEADSTVWVDEQTQDVMATVCQGQESGGHVVTSGDLSGLLHRKGRPPGSISTTITRKAAALTLPAVLGPWGP